MTNDVHSVLEKQIKLFQLEKEQMVRRQVALLSYLAPLFARHIGRDPGFNSLFFRAFLKELRNCHADYNSLIEIVESAGDFDVDAFMEFAMVAQLLAGIDLTTETEQEFWVEWSKASRCENCSRGYRLIALSAGVLLEPFSHWFAMETSHATDEIYDGATSPLIASLDALIPPS